MSGSLAVCLSVCLYVCPSGCLAVSLILSLSGLAGHLGSSGAAGALFSRTKNQPKKDLRPHIQLIFYGLLLGADEAKKEFWSDVFNFRRDVSSKHFLIIPVHETLLTVDFALPSSVITPNQDSLCFRKKLHA